MTSPAASSITFDVSIRCRWLFFVLILVGLKRFAVRRLVKLELRE